MPLSDKLTLIFFASLLWLATFFIVLATHPQGGLAILLVSLVLLGAILLTRKSRKSKTTL